MRKIIYLIALFIPLVISSSYSLGADLEVTIDVLEPSEEPGKMAPGIQYLKEPMSRSPLKYQSYMELATAFRSIPMGEKSTINFNLRRYLKLEISPIKIAEDTVRFTLKIWSGGDLIIDTDLSLVRQGTVMVGAPGDPNLIIAISEGF